MQRKEDKFVRISALKQEKYEEIHKIKQENSQLLQQVRSEEKEKVQARYLKLKEDHERFKHIKQSSLKERASRNVDEKLNEIVS